MPDSVDPIPANETNSSICKSAKFLSPLVWTMLFTGDTISSQVLLLFTV